MKKIFIKVMAGPGCEISNQILLELLNLEIILFNKKDS